MKNKRNDKAIIIRIQQYVYHALGMQFKRARKCTRRAEANEIVSALVDMYELQNYSISKNDIAPILQCSPSAHRQRIRRFYEKYSEENRNYKSKASRIMEQCITNIEDEYNHGLPNGAAKKLLARKKVERSSTDSNGGGYKQFMATLQDLDRKEAANCGQSGVNSDDVSKASGGV